MKNFGNLMKQAQSVQVRIQEVNQRLGKMEISGASGGGMVSVTLNGKCEMMRIKIDPSLFNAEDVGVLEDLIVAAYGDAKNKADDRSQEEMSKVTQGIALPPELRL